MAFTLETLANGSLGRFDTVIDVRSPSEFAQDHVPGAINLPVMSDQERARVGTIYVRDSAFRARKIGAAIVARNAAAHIETTLGDKDGGWQPLVYCWRGGQRSGSFASILSQIGWRTELLTGGYRSYRRLVVNALYDTALPHRLALLDGNTGSGKTAILAVLRQQGVQVLDLEGLAAHRGSVLGATDVAQPAQKMFESRIAAKLAEFDPARPVVVEAESSKVGQCIVPRSLWKAMLSAPRIEISASLPARAAFLTRDYRDVLQTPDHMATRLNRLRPICGHARVDHWIELLNTGAFNALAADLMARHYDPGYARSRAAHTHRVLAVLTTDDLGDQSLADMANQVGELLDQV